MGKSKKRSLKNGINDKFPYLTREKALKFVVEHLSTGDDVMDKITLFGFSAEEMLEAGATYEDVMSLGALVN